MKKQKIYLCRHGETEWSLSGQHTSFSDIALTENGENEAVALRSHLKKLKFTAVYSSPLKRAKETAMLAGFKDFEIRDELFEWRYGQYEGITTDEIHRTDPGWTVFDGVIPDGETSEEVTARAQKIIADIRELEGNIALFSHGHYLRAFAACWLGMSAAEGRYFKLGTAALSILGYDRKTPAIEVWNETSHIS